MPHRDPSAAMHALFTAGDVAWQRFRARCGNAFHAFVPGDYPGALHALRTLRPQADSFLELGSGVGVITIIAALLGYEAAGIEIDPWLVDQSETLAAEFGADATFACGSFVPDSFQPIVDRHETELPTVLDGHPAYAELGADLADFDLVYAFYWPGHERLFEQLMRRHGRPGALLLTYGGIEGYRAWRDGRPVPLPGA
ncbi:MAG: class I SAM-dependent methyltransferase [Planctomycetes bacterium]|nr:class I SAM-dependent methyltransferase [Planctomycetota bacterium]MCB9868406.1 class I SAM-dependent methyltransferase [Planctomycetota bacterium]